MTATEALHVVQTVASLDQGSGGTSQVVSRLSDELVDAGCRVSIAYLQVQPGDNCVTPARATVAPARVHTLFGHAVWSPDFATSIRRALPTAAPRLIHDNGLWHYANVVAADTARRQGVPLVISPHGMLEPWAMGYKARKKRIAWALYQRRILASATMFVATAASEYESLRRAGYKQPVALIPPGVPLPSSPAHHAASAPLRTLLFLSRIHPKKGLIPFIEAWSSLRPEGWKVIVAGPDEAGHKAELEKLLEERGARSEFEFPGAVTGAAKHALFANADVFVLPTFSENFGVAVAEALSFGLPVLTTRGAPWQILDTLNAGWWVEPGIAGLTAGLHAAVSTSAETRKAMGQAGRHYVASTLAWPTAGRNMVQAYRWALGLDAAKPDCVQVD